MYFIVHTSCFVLFCFCFVLSFFCIDQKNTNQPTSISEAIQLLPLYSMALQKNLAFRGGTDVRTDDRANVQSQLANMPVDHSRCFTYPRMFRCVRACVMIEGYIFIAFFRFFVFPEYFWEPVPSAQHTCLLAVLFSVVDERGEARKQYS